MRKKWKHCSVVEHYIEKVVKRSVTQEGEGMDPLVKSWLSGMRVISWIENQSIKSLFTGHVAGSCPRPPGATKKLQVHCSSWFVVISSTVTLFGNMQ